MPTVEAEDNARRPKQVFEDWLTITEFAAEANVSERTVRNWMNEVDGLPYAKRGAKRIINIPRARQWLQGREVQRNPRRRGRPR